MELSELRNVIAALKNSKLKASAPQEERTLHLCDAHFNLFIMSAFSKEPRLVTWQHQWEPAHVCDACKEEKGEKLRSRWTIVDGVRCGN